MTERDDLEPTEWVAIAMAPYCGILTPSIARPAHFAKFARTLAAAADAGVCNNDVCCDNLMVVLASDNCEDEGGEAFIVDWGMVSKPGAVQQRKPSGKNTFLPLSCIDEGTGAPKQYEASLLHDLEALYLVAICCAKGDVPWATVKPESVFSTCANYCGVGNRCRQQSGSTLRRSPRCSTSRQLTEDMNCQTWRVSSQCSSVPAQCRVFLAVCANRMFGTVRILLPAN